MLFTTFTQCAFSLYSMAYRRLNMESYFKMYSSSPSAPQRDGIHNPSSMLWISSWFIWKKNLEGTLRTWTCPRSIFIRRPNHLNWPIWCKVAAVLLQAPFGWAPSLSLVKEFQTLVSTILLDQYPKLMAIGEGWNVEWLIGKLRASCSGLAPSSPWLSGILYTLLLMLHQSTC